MADFKNIFSNPDVIAALIQGGLGLGGGILGGMGQSKENAQSREMTNQQFMVDALMKMQQNQQNAAQQGQQLQLGRDALVGSTMQMNPLAQQEFRQNNAVLAELMGGASNPSFNFDAKTGMGGFSGGMQIPKGGFSPETMNFFSPASRANAEQMDFQTPRAQMAPNIPLTDLSKVGYGAPPQGGGPPTLPQGGGGGVSTGMPVGGGRTGYSGSPTDQNRSAQPPGLANDHFSFPSNDAPLAGGGSGAVIGAAGQAVLDAWPANSPAMPPIRDQNDPNYWSRENQQRLYFASNGQEGNLGGIIATNGPKAPGGMGGDQLIPPGGQTSSGRDVAMQQLPQGGGPMGGGMAGGVKPPTMGQPQDFSPASNPAEQFRQQRLGQMQTQQSAAQGQNDASSAAIMQALQGLAGPQAPANGAPAPQARKKSGGGFWKTLGKIGAVAAPIVAAPFTGGASLAAIGALSGAAGGALSGGGWKGAALGAGLGAIPGMGAAKNTVGSAAQLGAGGALKNALLNPQALTKIGGAAIPGQAGALTQLAGSLLPGPKSLPPRNLPGAGPVMNGAPAGLNPAIGGGMTPPSQVGSMGPMTGIPGGLNPAIGDQMVPPALQQLLDQLKKQMQPMPSHGMPLMSSHVRG